MVLRNHHRPKARVKDFPNNKKELLYVFLFIAMNDVCTMVPDR